MSTGPDPVRAAMRGRCPRCGKGRLFRTTLQLADRCAVCDLDIAGFNVGDGPAAFLILLLGFVVVGLSLWFDIAVAPPWWVHAILWPPLIVVLTVIGLRQGKAVLLALEFKHDAAEGRLDD